MAINFRTLDLRGFQNPRGLLCNNFYMCLKGLKIACLEVIACKMGYITKQQLLQLAEPLKKNGYGQYLIRRAKEFS